MNRYLLTSIVLLILAACQPKTEDKAVTVSTTVYHEPHRPQIHFSPREKWMNDPNGLFYLDGEYHLFFQHYPDSIVWGPMHWGHAVSKDMLRWEQLPIALYPDSLGYIFSGSVVVDNNNTSGFGDDAHTPVVAIYTYHDPKGDRAGSNTFQTQGIAYSIDKGRSWKKYEANPVLSNPGIRDFRDPKVSWNTAAKQWVMTLAVKDHIEFYGSPNLKQWTKLSEFGKTEGDHGGVWECPDLFELKNEQGETAYVLLVSINPGAPNGGSGTQYFIGTFDGKKFINDTPGKQAGWIDYGMDNYAGVTFSNIPADDGRRILMGWMTNWHYAQVTPQPVWRGANTLPRAMSIKTIDGKKVLASLPVKELENLVSTSQSIQPNGDTLIIRDNDALHLTPSKITGKIRTGDFVIELSNSLHQKIIIGLDAAKREFYLDRRLSGNVSFHPDFERTMTAPRLATGEWVDFSLVVDAASVEVFFDGGTSVLTAIHFSDGDFTQLKIYSRQGDLKADSVSVSSLTSIWK